MDKMKLMKYIPLVFSALIILVLTSCEDEDTIRVPEFKEAATMRIQVVPEFSFINFADLANGKLQFSLFTENDNLDRMELSLEYYNLGQDSLYPKMIWRTFSASEFGSDGIIRDVTFTTQDLIDFYNLPSEATVTGGDRMDFSNVTYLTDGRMYPDTVLKNTDFETVNVTPNIINANTTTSFSVGFTAYVACPTVPEDWEGDYATAVSNVDNFCGLLDCSATADATIAFVGTPEPFRYSTSSHDGGLWGSFDPGSLNAAGDFYNICEVPLLLPGNSAGYGDHLNDPANPNPPRDAGTGVIVMNWCNFFNPVCGTTTYTPK